MYKLLTIKERVRIPPQTFKENLRQAVEEAIEKQYVGIVSKKHGFFLTLVDIAAIGDGIIIPGDGAIYYETTFKILTFKPILQEVIEGKISEITEFGAFIHMGPMDGLVHVSQIMDDYVNYNKAGSLSGKQTKRVLKVGDIVRAKIIAISLKATSGAKIGLTMRQPGLGKLEWVEKDKPHEEKVVVAK